MWALGIKDMDELPDAQDRQALFTCCQFFDFAFGDGLEYVFFAAAKLESMHGRKGKVLLLKKSAWFFVESFSISIFYRQFPNLL